MTNPLLQRCLESKRRVQAVAGSPERRYAAATVGLACVVSCVPAAQRPDCQDGEIEALAGELERYAAGELGDDTAMRLRIAGLLRTAIGYAVMRHGVAVCDADLGSADHRLALAFEMAATVASEACGETNGYTYAAANAVGFAVAQISRLGVYADVQATASAAAGALDGDESDAAKIFEFIGLFCRWRPPSTPETVH